MNKSSNGAVTLEACISVFSFLMLMLFISSLFVMFMAQNTTAHTLLQTSQSMSLDAYSAEHIGTGGWGSVSEIAVSIADFISNLFGSNNNNSTFTSRQKWYDGTQDEIVNMVKTRFIGYLSGGDATAADEFLKNMNVVDGLDGLDFSESYVDSGNLYIVLKYDLEYDFNIGNLKAVEVKQTTCSKLWK